MAKLTTDQIRVEARRIIAATPGGVRFKQLVRAIQGANPETPINTVMGSVWDLAARFPDEVGKPSRGLFVPLGRPSPGTKPGAGPHDKASNFREEDFYEPFAEWLRTELDEATVAVPSGGSSMKQKWGTPDVVGVYKPLASHRIKFDPEIVSAEIKIDPNEPVVAFGQAAAYRLFSAKCYIAMPSNISEENSSRLEALCMLYGIGLVLFEPNPKDPGFAIRVRAQRIAPDMFYVNEFAERIFQIDPGMFNQLFG
jgi:hypothetical protein